MSEPSTITKLDIRAYRAEIQNPVVASFGSIPSRATVLLRIEDSDGAHGWGEIWGNFPTITTEYRAKLAAWTLPSRLIGATIDEPGAFTDALATKLRVLKVQAAETGPVEGVLAATNQALWDLRARKRGVPLRHLYQRRKILTRKGFPFWAGCDSRLAKEIRHVSMHCSSGRLRQH